MYKRKSLTTALLLIVSMALPISAGAAVSSYSNVSVVNHNGSSATAYGRFNTDTMRHTVVLRSSKLSTDYAVYSQASTIGFRNGAGVSFISGKTPRTSRVGIPMVVTSQGGEQRGRNSTHFKGQYQASLDIPWRFDKLGTLVFSGLVRR